MSAEHYNRSDTVKQEPAGGTRPIERTSWSRGLVRTGLTEGPTPWTFPKRPRAPFDPVVTARHNKTGVDSTLATTLRSCAREENCGSVAAERQADSAPIGWD